MKALFALNRYIWKYKRLLLLGLLCVLLTNFFAIYPAQIVRTAIDTVSHVVEQAAAAPTEAAADALRKEVVWSLLKFGAAVVLMAFMRGLFLFFVRQTLIVMSRYVEYDLRNDLFNHLQRLTLSFYRRTNTGDIMARVTEDVSRVRMYLGPGIMYTLNTGVLMVMVVATMFSVNAELTIYTLIPLPILSILIFSIESAVLKRSDDLQKQLSHITTLTQETYSGIRLIKAYVKEKDSVRKFAAASEIYKAKSLKLSMIDALFFPSVTILVGASTLLTMWISGEKVIGGSLTVGNIAEFLIYINLLTWPIISLGWTSTLIQRAAASQARLNVLLAEKPDMTFPEESSSIEAAEITFDKVTFVYPDTGIRALKNISFEIKAGQKIGIVGATGSGKSTLATLIARMYDVTEGEIQIGGKPIQTYSEATLRGAIGYAPQDVFLFSDTISQNIAFGQADASAEEIEQAARNASIYQNIADFPEGFNTVVGERGVTLSGGQKQRISIARAWIRKPKLLVLDDVLSAVDTRTEEEILRNLKNFRNEHPETAVLVVAHRISCIQDSDVILVLEHGQIAEMGTHEALLQNGGYYARIYEKQITEETTAA